MGAVAVWTTMPKGNRKQGVLIYVAQLSRFDPSWFPKPVPPFSEVPMVRKTLGNYPVLKRGSAAAALALACSTTQAGGGPLGIDHELAFDQGGIWGRGYQLSLEYGVIATAVGGALWLGNDTELGHTFWQTIDAGVISSAAAVGLQYAFGRARPTAGKGPNQWFTSGGHSFPSGEVTLQAAFVTPVIVNYGSRDPWVWALELLPAYDAVARVKSQAHWQTDVLAGWALGSAVGYWATRWKTPLFVQILPHGFTVGFSKRF
ncbi:undecaprenyl-diphosphatase [Trinickia symbiotica]|nr:phosphatase PAP2 family protein [Trinickia symbiotica]PPK47675.1 undecaprenyl-diphosphatase [Trinickia symbiotica]